MAGSKIAGQPRKSMDRKVRSELERLANWGNEEAKAEIERRDNPPIEDKPEPPSKKKAK